MKKSFTLRPLCLMAALTYALTVWSIPAQRKPYTYTQPDGTTLTLYKHGNAQFHWWQTADGQWMSRDANGSFQPCESLNHEQIVQRVQSLQAPAATTAQSLKLNLAPRGLVILVEFTDVQFQPENDHAAFAEFLMGDDYHHVNKGYDDYKRVFESTATGSAHQYFYDQSLGQYDPQFDLVGPVMVSKPYSYYGENVTYYGQSINDAKTTEMISEAVRLADPEVDFSLYDNDDDGKVDFVFFIYAGYGEADTDDENTIWPAKLNLTDYNISLRVDGKRIGVCAYANELNPAGTRTGIGTFVHEFSHVCGLPDLYDINYSNQQRTPGSWDVLDHGPYNNNSNTPPSYSAYERWFCGWAVPTIIDRRMSCTLHPTPNQGEAYLITETGSHNMDGVNPDPSVFYLLEYRQQQGWDASLPGHGMMLTKIQYSYRSWISNTVNTSRTSLGVDIIEADNKNTGSYVFNSGKQGDLFPYKDYDFIDHEIYTRYEATDYTITDIKEKNGMITFNVNGGVAPWEAEVFKEEYSGSDEIAIEAIYQVLNYAVILPLTTTNLMDLPLGEYLIRYTVNGDSKRKYHKKVVISE